MKKVLILFLLIVFAKSNAQNQLPNVATAISPLLIGAQIPELNLETIDGNLVNILKLIKSKKTILVFYRGGWCPYCNSHLSALGETEAELLAKGYQIVAISPDSPESLQATKSKDKVNFTLLSDSDGTFAKALGIAFQAPDNYKPYIAKGSDGKNPGYLPVPSLFILDTEGSIIFEYLSPDYKHRISNALLLSVVNAL